MLVLSRKEGESLVIHGRITVKVLDIRGRKVRLGIDAPREITILRPEILAHPAERRRVPVGGLAHDRPRR